MRWSSVESTLSAHSRMMSAPYCSMTLSGSIVLPRLLDILRPSLAMVKPCVSTWS
jgi:hypothetical protein